MTPPPSFSSRGGRRGGREAESLGTFGEGGCGGGGGGGRGGNRDGVMSEDDWGHQGAGGVSRPC